MPDEFDPYLAWLGIPPTARPANHYQLLGLPEWECDRARIAAAADQRMGEVRSYQTGPRGKFTQKILNELSVAKLCLLDPRAKETYDVGLVRQRATSQPVAPQPAAVLYMPVEAPPPVAPPTMPPPAPPPTSAPRAVTQHRASAMQASEEPREFNRWWLALGLFFVAGIGSAVVAVANLPKVAVKPIEVVENVDEPKVKVPSRPELDDTLVILQEGSGDLSFPASTAELTEGLQRRDEGGESLIEGWQAETAVARWKFKIIRPAVFQVRLVYTAEQAEGAAWQLRIDDSTKVRDVQSSPAAGAVVTDEFFWRVPRGGEHTFELSLTSLPPGTSVALKSVRFIYQPGGKLQ